MPRLPRLPFRPAPDVVRIVLVWAAWLAIICTFQIVVQARLSPQRPDDVLAWTPNEDLSANVGVNYEKRQGTRPYGATFGSPGTTLLVSVTWNVPTLPATAPAHAARRVSARPK